MAYATTAQIAYLNRLARERGFTGPVEAADEYGLGLRSPSSLTMSEASELIDYMKAPRDAQTAMRAAVAATTEQNNVAAAAIAAEASARALAEGQALRAREAAAASERAALDALLEARGLGHLTGAEKREARRLLRREMDARA